MSTNGGNVWGKTGVGKEWGVYSYGLDVNGFNGTEQDFERLFRFNIEPALPVEPEKVNAVRVNYLSNIRRGAGITHTVVMGVPKGIVLPTEFAKTGLDNQIWYRIAGGDGEYQMWISSEVCTPVK